MSKIPVFLCSLFLFHPITVGVNSFKLIISPPIVNLKLQPNKTKKVNLTVYNQNDHQISLSIKACALEMDTKGNAFASDKTNDPFSCVSWLKFAETDLVLNPDSKKVVPVEVNVPYGASGEKYGIVLFQTTIQNSPDSEVLLIGRMGAIFMIEVYGPKKIEGQITEFNIRKENRLICFRAKIQNNGNAHFKLKGSVIIKDERDKIVDRVNLDVGTGTILPVHEREFEGEWKNQKKMQVGNYKAILQILIPGSGRTLQEIKSFTIT